MSSSISLKTSHTSTIGDSELLAWHFKELEADYPDDATLAAKNFRRESTEFPEIFIREVVQNVLDARDETHAGAVRLVIRILDEHSGLNTTRFKNDFVPLEAHLVPAGHTNERDFAHPKVLIAEEYGTVGLTGRVDDSRARGVAERWSNFWHGEGKRSKGGRSLGRAGQGKITYHMASASQALLALSVRKSAVPEKCVFGKCIVQKTHFIEPKHYMRHGYWRQVRSDLGVQPLPATDESFIGQFRSDYMLERNNEHAGTSWIIPFPLPALTRDALIKAVLKDFHFSVLRGVLEVQICGVKINQNTIADLIPKYIDPKQISPAFVTFLTDVITTNGDDRISAKPEWQFVNTALDPASFSEADLSKLEQAFELGTPISVRFPVTITKLDASMHQTHFDVHLARPEGLERTEELYVRSDLVISDEKWLKEAAGKALGAMIADDDVISEFLGNAEEASHLKWNAAEDELRTRYKAGEARELLSRVRHSLPRLYRLLAGQMSGINEDALQHILSIPDEASGKKKTTKAGKKAKKKEKTEDDDDDDEKKWKPNPKPFIFSDIAGGVRVTPGDLNLMKGARAEIKFAYARVEGEGNPFSRYHPFDFDLADASRIKIEKANGLCVLERTENALIVEIEDSRFQVEVTGFTDAYRLVCKARTLAGVDDVGAEIE